MRTLILIALISATATLSAQTASNNLILTKEQNDKWFLQLKQATLKNQIELISARFSADTAVFVPHRTDRYKEVSFQTLKAARTNPVKALRYE